MRARLLLTAAVLLLAVANTPSVSAATSASQHAWTAARPLPAFVPQNERIYVALTAGSEEARSFVELSGDAAADAAGGATLMLREADDGLLQAEAEWTACALAAPLDGDGRLEAGPAVDCAVHAPAVRTDEGEWHVPLRVFADRWALGGPIGVGLLPTIGPTPETWRVSLDALRTSVNVPTGTVVDDDGEQPPPPPPSGSADTAPDEDDFTGDLGPLPDAAAKLPASPPARVDPVVLDEQPPRRAARVATAREGGDASHPQALGWLGAIALGGVAIGALLQRMRTVGATGGGVAGRTGDLAVGLGVLVALLMLAGAGDVMLYKLGLVLIVFVAAIGLHVLVSWAGELSLAHAGFVGAPAFVVAKLSSENDLSPVYLLPVGVLAGALLGALVGLPALRAKGLHVALVTLAAFVAIDRFLFTKTWFVGPAGGYDIPIPTLGPFELGSVRSLYPVLVMCTGIAVVAAWVLWRSKFARALLWMRAMPAAASAFGIPVASYKVAAYALAGAFGGFAGGLTVVWVQRLTPGAFPFQLSFAYLVIVVLAGRGFLGGVAVAAAALEGGRLFVSGVGPVIAYAGPIGLLVTLTRYKTGLNGFGRQVMQTITRRFITSAKAAVPPQVRWTTIAGATSMVAGLMAIGLGWYHAGNTDQVWIQNQEMLSGGVGGLALVVIGVGLLIRDQLVRSQERFVAALAEAIATGARVDNGNGAVALATTVDAGATSGAGVVNRTSMRRARHRTS